jgi:hypothetical protein
MLTYLTTMSAAIDTVVVSAGRKEDDSGLVVVGANNFDSETFFFPLSEKASAPYAVITDAQGCVIRFSILRS